MDNRHSAYTSLDLALSEVAHREERFDNENQERIVNAMKYILEGMQAIIEADKKGIYTSYADSPQGLPVWAFDLRTQASQHVTFRNTVTITGDGPEGNEVFGSSGALNLRAVRVIVPKRSDAYICLVFGSNDEHAQTFTIVELALDGRVMPTSHRFEFKELLSYILGDAHINQVVNNNYSSGGKTFMNKNMFPGAYEYVTTHIKELGPYLEGVAHSITQHEY